MNEIHPSDDLLDYQTKRLRELIEEIIHCCQERTLYGCERFGLRQAELKCLMLFEGEKYLTVKGIAPKMDVAKSRVTKIVDGLVRKGLIQRVNDPDDGRVTLICLTSQGQQKSKEIQMFFKDIHQRLLLQMDSDERKETLTSLELLRGSMEAVKGTLKWNR